MTAGQPDLLARFRRKIAANAIGWLTFLQAEPLESAALTREFPNLSKAAAQALTEPVAWEAGLALVTALWPLVERRGYWLEWRDVLERGLAVSRAAQLPRFEALVLDQRGELRRTLSDYAAARVDQEAALAMYRQTGDIAGEGRMLAHLSQQYLALRDLEQADRCSREAVRLLSAAGDDAELASAYNDWGLVCFERDELDAALENYAHAIRLTTLLGNRRGQGKARHNQGIAYRRQGRLEEAITCFREAVVLLAAIGDDITVARCRLSLSIALHAAGQDVEALAVSQEIEPLFRSLGDRQQVAFVLNNQGVFLQAMGRPAEAAQRYEQAVQLHQALGDRLNQASSLSNWAEALLDEGQVGAATERLDQAQALLASVKSLPAWVMRTYTSMRERAANAR